LARGIKCVCEERKKNAKFILVCAQGWDCPRALFRDWHSFNFSIQTLGRIMRMPEPKIGHYKNESLNQAYIYTNIDSVEIQDDVSADYIEIYSSHRDNKKYKNLNLKSVYSLRQREKTRLSPKFIEFFMKCSSKYELYKKIKLKNQSAQISFLKEYKSDEIDNLIGTSISSKDNQLKLNVKNDEDLQRLFDFFIRDNLQPFFPEDRSVEKVKQSIYEYFLKKHKISFENNSKLIANIVLSKHNRDKFIRVINDTKEVYKKKILITDNKLTEISNWEIPKQINYSKKFDKFNFKKTILKPYFGNLWTTEVKFIEYLEKSKNVQWWFKNGDRDATYFAIPYRDNGQSKPFYVDFIIKLKKPIIYLIDIKSGFTISESSEKSNGLLDYISKYKKKLPKLLGGIVTNRDQRKHKDNWIIFLKHSKFLNPNNLQNWDSLNI